MSIVGCSETWNSLGRDGCGSRTWIHWRRSSDMSLWWFFLWSSLRRARRYTLPAPWTYCPMLSPFSCRLSPSTFYTVYMRRRYWSVLWNLTVSAYTWVSWVWIWLGLVLIHVDSDTNMLTFFCLIVPNSSLSWDFRVPFDTSNWIVFI